MSVFSSVVLPTPLRPITQTSEPAGTSSDTPNSTWVRPPRDVEIFCGQHQTTSAAARLLLRPR